MGFPGASIPHRRQPVLPKHLRNALRLADQRVVVGICTVQDIQPRRVVLAQQLPAPLVKVLPRRLAGTQTQPPRQMVAAQGHVLLSVVPDLGVGAGQCDPGIVQLAPQERGLAPHDVLRPLSVAVGNTVVVGHALVHLRQLAVQPTRLPVEHHQHRRGPEGPAALPPDTHRRTGHLGAGAAVQAAHTRDVVVEQEAHDEVALAPQVARSSPGISGRAWMAASSCSFSAQHLGDAPPVEHAAHQHQHGQRVPAPVPPAGTGPARRAPAPAAATRAGFPRPSPPPAARRQSPPRPVGPQGLEILAAFLVPLAVPAAAALLRFRRQRPEGPLGTLLHHVMESVGRAVRQPRHEGVSCRQVRDLRRRVRIFGDGLRHLLCELVRQPQHGQKRLTPQGQRLQSMAAENMV